MATTTAARRRVNVSSGGEQERIVGYSRAVRHGEHVHVSGTCAPVGNENKSAYEQAKVAYGIIGRALHEAGATFSDVVRTVVYVTDINEGDQVGRAHSEIFSTIRPATTMVQVSRLFRPWQRVEIEVYAIVDDSR